MVKRQWLNFRTIIAIFRVSKFLEFYNKQDCQNLEDLSRCMTKSTKWPVHPAKTQIRLGIRPVWSVFTVCMKKHWVLASPKSTQWSLIRLGGCPGWTVSSLGGWVNLLVLSCSGSFYFPLSGYNTKSSSWSLSPTGILSQICSLKANATVKGENPWFLHICRYPS